MRPSHSEVFIWANWEQKYHHRMRLIVYLLFEYSLLFPKAVPFGYGLFIYICLFSMNVCLCVCIIFECVFSLNSVIPKRIVYNRPQMMTLNLGLFQYLISFSCRIWSLLGCYVFYKEILFHGKKKKKKCCTFSWGIWNEKPKQFEWMWPHHIWKSFLSDTIYEEQ